MWREVPHERAHQRIDLALERVVVEVGDERERAVAGRGEVCEQVGDGRCHRESIDRPPPGPPKATWG